MGDHLNLSRGEEDSGGRSREYILANTFEAVLGAIFLDQGLPKAKEFLEKNLFPKIDNIYNTQSYRDYKSRFQELTQEKHNQTPEYKEIQTWGPDHDKRFLMGAYLSGNLVGQGEGASKQKAEQEAAKDALEKLK
jgi:ribonuclease-3